MAEADGQLPHDPGAERAVLAAVLVDDRQLDTVRELVAAKDFLDARHQRIFQAFCALDDAGERRRIDLVTVRAQLEREGQLAAAGGAAYLGELIGGVARSSNAEDYARVVRDHSLSRQLHRLGSQLAGEAVRDPPKQVMAAAEKHLFEITEGSFGSGPVRITEEVRRIAAESEQKREDFAGIPTGFEKLDKLIGGLRKSDLILLGARPGEGKTSLALNIALAAAGPVSRKSVLIFSLEMPLRQIAIRLLFSHAWVNSQMFSGREMLGERDRKLLRRSLPVLQDMRIHVDDSNVTPVELRSKARQLLREEGLDLIMVDYLQLMRGAEAGERRFENRNIEIAEISRSLKSLGKELKVPVLALSQLSRAPDKREFSQPQLSDLRESGALEQDADIVLFIHRDGRRRSADSGGEAARRPRPSRSAGPADFTGQDEESPVRRIIVAKNRNGPTGFARLAWIPQYTRFETMVDESGRDEDEESEYPVSDYPLEPGI